MNVTACVALSALFVALAALVPNGPFAVALAAVAVVFAALALNNTRNRSPR